MLVLIFTCLEDPDQSILNQHQIPTLGRLITYQFLHNESVLTTGLVPLEVLRNRICTKHSYETPVRAHVKPFNSFLSFPNPMEAVSSTKNFFMKSYSTYESSGIRMSLHPRSIGKGFKPLLLASVVMKLPM
jgi:hypothetical protein